MWQAYMSFDSAFVRKMSRASYNHKGTLQMRSLKEFR
jgi:hypothetical protein